MVFYILRFRSPAIFEFFNTIALLDMPKQPDDVRSPGDSRHPPQGRDFRFFPKRTCGKNTSREEVAHRVAWAAVKRRYGKSGDRWIARQPA